MAEARQSGLVDGLVVSAHGRHYVVELADGTALHCYPRGKRSDLACGDRVRVRRAAADQAVIESVAQRTSALYRSDDFRQKVIAANVTQVLVVVAGRPPFSEELLVRCLVAAEQQRLKALVVLNKIDLEVESAAASKRLRLYEQLGYPLLKLSAREDVSPLCPWLSGQTSVLVGQSGMGKSRIVKALVPDAEVRIGEISEALGAGRHTTTSARLYHLDRDSHLIDSPGMQTFGLQHLSLSELADAFPELRPLRGACRFKDCRHVIEPGCAIRAAVEEGKIEPRRWQAYRAIAEELAEKRPDWA
ncbi:MAG TPA: ribosome small subunit-dependent GTPase A [Burkholderiales bacterium]|nr:ribosome small subunit-dependent GTPase A [Burkholderiales bacterium]